MKRSEMLERYRDIVLEINGIEKQMDFIMSIGPSDVRSINLTGMPHGTNDPQASAGQHYDKYAEKLLAKREMLYDMMDECERIMEELTEPRERDIIRRYYFIGWTDQAISQALNLERSSVTKIRNDTLARLDR